jgi:hypothetical protein
MGFGAGMPLPVTVAVLLPAIPVAVSFLEKFRGSYVFNLCHDLSSSVHLSLKSSKNIIVLHLKFAHILVQKNSRTAMLIRSAVWLLNFKKLLMTDKK